MKLRIKKQVLLKHTLVNQMFAIYQKSYNISEKAFRDKMNTIDSYALYFTSENKLVGFTGIRKKAIDIEKDRYKAYYIGQTIILPEYRGKSLIQRTIVRLFINHYLKNPFRKVIVWNDSLSYRPYLVMAKGLKQFYPSPHPIASEKLRAVRNALGTIYYGDTFCPMTGIVSKKSAVLSPAELAISAEKLADPYVQFYVNQNPKYYEGNGLITLCPANLRNLFYYLSNKKR